MVDPPLALTLDLHHSARALAQDHQLSFYDALIVASAIEAGCDTLFSEDMQHAATSVASRSSIRLWMERYRLLRS